MDKIKALPENLIYHPSTQLKITGKPKMVLDVSRTAVHMISENLKGVDCVVAKRGQIRYIAPDFSGDVVWLDVVPEAAQKRYSHTLVSGVEKQFLVRSYVAQKRFNPTIFDETLRMPDEDGFEQNLPKNLKFSWDFGKDCGCLDARGTSLRLQPHVANVTTVLMPIISDEKLAKKRIEKDR